MTVAELIAKYRAADEAARAEDGGEPYSLDPTSVWTVEEFRQVVEAAESAPTVLGAV